MNRRHSSHDEPKAFRVCYRARVSSTGEEDHACRRGRPSCPRAPKMPLQLALEGRLLFTGHSCQCCSSWLPAPCATKSFGFEDEQRCPAAACLKARLLGAKAVQNGNRLTYVDMALPVSELENRLHPNEADYPRMASTYAGARHDVVANKVAQPAPATDGSGPDENRFWWADVDGDHRARYMVFADDGEGKAFPDRAIRLNRQRTLRRRRDHRPQRTRASQTSTTAPTPTARPSSISAQDGALVIKAEATAMAEPPAGKSPPETTIPRQGY
jgi:hypothetical protein